MSRGFALRCQTRFQIESMSFWDLCWSRDPVARPTMAALKQQLQQIYLDQAEETSL
eukprot:m.169534 g.169534  ORF g.169534 m.169534 type:complete len:56 (+) comp16670_c0_seq1:2366-2533(+)